VKKLPTKASSEEREIISKFTEIARATIELQRELRQARTELKERMYTNMEVLLKYNLLKLSVNWRAVNRERYAE